MKITGIRPAEKMHEIMVSEEEATRCVKRGDYYAIRPMLPELQEGEEIESNALNKELSSADTVLDLPNTEALLKMHRLMVDDTQPNMPDELLR